MATIVLGTAGRLLGGPIGGIIGTTIGGVIDSRLFGGSQGGGGRLSNLAVQSAAYGEPIAVITGRLRAAGNLLWTSGIRESTSGGGKGQGSSYAYSASFAVGLAGREIDSVGRIWADGKLIRDSNGGFLSPVTMRLHAGSESQAPDPLIAAFEGSSGAPAYRGIAYAVFEDMPLADYGNRIPNLTFEVIADGGDGHDMGRAISVLATVEGRPLVVTEGGFPRVAGHFAGQSGTVAEAVASLVTLSGAAVAAGEGLLIRGDGAAATALPADDCHARLPGADHRRERRKLFGGESRTGGVEVVFYDTGRDYQPGLQRARRDGAGPVEQRSIACAMSPADAKLLAADLLARSEAARWQISVRMPWRHLGVRPGDHVLLDDQPGTWRVRQTRFESFIVNLDLERTASITSVEALTDGGRAQTFDDQPAGETTLAILDLPSLPGELAQTPRLWIAAAGASAGWRRAPIEVSADFGETYATLGTAAGPTVIGNALTALPHGPTDGWDRFSVLDVEVLVESMWLEARPETSVLAGANLAMIGAEVFQFADIEALGPRRFRLTGLLRGRLGSEAATTGHAAGERFVMLDKQALLPFDPPADAMGRSFRFRPAGRGDAAALPTDVGVTGRALRPLCPVHLNLSAETTDVVATWVRRSRAGFGWADFVDAPVSETIEAYQVDVMLDGRPARSMILGVVGFVYTRADRLADGGGTMVTIRVAQLSAAVGPGVAAEASILLSS